MYKTVITTLAVSAFSASAAFADNHTPLSEMPAGTYVLDKTHASLTWKVSHLGLSDYTARFTDFDATIELNPEDLTSSKVTATINPTSIKTDYPKPEEKDFDKKLVEGEDWFNAGTFADITFESKELTKTGENTGKMMGHLTFLGETKPVTLDVTFNKAMKVQPFTQLPALGFSATGTLKRSDWGMNTYVPNIGDAVDLLIEVEFMKPAE